MHHDPQDTSTGARCDHEWLVTVNKIRTRGYERVHIIAMMGIKLNAQVIVCLQELELSEHWPGMHEKDFTSAQLQVEGSAKESRIELESRGWSIRTGPACKAPGGPHTGGRFKFDRFVGGGRRGTVTV